MSMIPSMITSTPFPTPDELAALTVTQYKAVENRLRRMARRQGLELEKNRYKDPRAIGYGTYQLVDEDGVVVHQRDAKRGYGLTIQEVAQILRY